MSELLLREALEQFIYEATHLSALEDDGGHKCKISAECLEKGRSALRVKCSIGHTHEQLCAIASTARCSMERATKIADAYKALSTPPKAEPAAPAGVREAFEAFYRKQLQDADFGKPIWNVEYSIWTAAWEAAAAHYSAQQPAGAEPVAWMAHEGEQVWNWFLSQAAADYYAKQFPQHSIMPLYTHPPATPQPAPATQEPRREFSDEQIDRAMKAMLGWHSGPYTASLRADFRRALAFLGVQPERQQGELEWPDGLQMRPAPEGMTVEELQLYISSLQMELQTRVCGDPMKGVGLTAPPQPAESEGEK